MHLRAAIRDGTSSRGVAGSAIVPPNQRRLRRVPGGMAMRWSVAGLCLGIFGCTPPADEDGGADIEVAAGDLERAVDAARSPTGEATYFLGDVDGVTGLHQARAGAPRKIAGGLVGASSLVITSDGVAAVVAAEHDGGRGLARVELADGELAWLDGAAERSARGLDLVRGDAGDVVVFTGADAEGPGVFRLALAGGDAERLAGFPADALLDGVAMTADGSLFVADGRGKVWHAAAGAAPTEVLAGVRVGDPAGVALTLDESTLLVSSLSAAGTSQVILLDTAAFTTTVFSDVIGENVGSGGVHRALDENQFAWSGVTKPRPGEGSGVVYDIGL